MYNAPYTFVLWFLPIVMLNVYLWGYFRHAYIHHSKVFIPAGSGRYSSSLKEDSKMELRFWILQDHISIVIKVDYSGVLHCGEGRNVELVDRTLITISCICNWLSHLIFLTLSLSLFTEILYLLSYLSCNIICLNSLYIKKAITHLNSYFKKNQEEMFIVLHQIYDFISWLLRLAKC